METIELRLTPQELDYIASVLATRPYNECWAVLKNIRHQVENQPKNDVPDPDAK